MTATDYELVIPDADWRAAVRPLLADPARWATGRLVRADRRPTGELLARDLTAAARTGADLPPLADWLAVAAPAGDPPADPAEWLGRLQPRPAQLLALLLVGFGPDRAGWRGWVIEGDSVRPLAGFRVVGPGMLRVGPADAPAPPDWSRLVGAVGDRAFAQLRAAEVVLVGCSRTGTQAAVQLAALGVRRLTLIDGDRVEPHNLDGMVLNGPADVGVNKAVALGRRLVEGRQDLCVTAVNRPLDSSRPDPTAGRPDLLVTCVDRDAPRFRAAVWARRRLVPHLDIGTGVTRLPTGERQLAADVRLLLPGAGCVRCVGGLGDPDQAEYELYAPPGALPRRPADRWDAGGRLGSLVTLNGLAVSAGVQSWLDLLGGSLAGSVWHRLRWRPGAGPEWHSGLVTAAAGCRVCGGHGQHKP